MQRIAETFRGGIASFRLLLLAPLAFARIASADATGTAGRSPISALASTFLDRCRFNVSVEGRAPAPGTGCVLCHNETSFADVVAYFAAVWPHADRIAGADLYGYLPFARRACRKLSIELVARGNRIETERLVEHMVTAVRNGERVGWGGEGRLSGLDGVGRFKLGGSLIAIRAKAPVIPVVIYGGHHAMRLGTVRARPGTIRIRFCEPVETDRYNETDARSLADRLQLISAETYAELASGSHGSES